jgi:hypothetical protein
MSSAYLPTGLRRQVERRARERCEYCQTQELIIGMPLEVEHIVPVVAGGATDEINLCLACPAAIVTKVRKWKPLMRQRRQNWYEHFRWQDDGLLIIGLTSTGRATINALQLNNRYLLRSRKLWTEQGWHPPAD